MIIQQGDLYGSKGKNSFLGMGPLEADARNRGTMTFYGDFT